MVVDAEAAEASSSSEDDVLGAHPANAALPASAAPASAAPDKKLRRLIPLVSFNMIPSSFNNRTMRQKARRPCSIALHKTHECHAAGLPALDASLRISDEDIVPSTSKKHTNRNG